MAKTLADQGRNPKHPWKQQIPTIRIDENLDYITDSGNEVWNILESQGIENVLLCGVHTNMCVLGRPFGLRQLASHGKSVALVRDLTDTMSTQALALRKSLFGYGFSHRPHRTLCLRNFDNQRPVVSRALVRCTAAISTRASVRKRQTSASGHLDGRR